PGASTGRTARQSVSNPPPKRMKARATTPTPWASSTSSNSMPPGPSDPASMPMARNSSSDGTPNRSDTLLASTPSSSSPAATAITGPGSIIAGPPAGARPPSRRPRRRRPAPGHHRTPGGEHGVAPGEPAAGAGRQLLLDTVDPHGAAGPADVGHDHDVAPPHDDGARPVVAPRLDRALAGVPQGRLAPAQREQLPVPGEHVAVGWVVPLLPPQHRRLPARRVLRVDHLVRRPPEAGQVALPAPPHRRGD